MRSGSGSSLEEGQQLVFSVGHIKWEGPVTWEGHVKWEGLS